MRVFKNATPETVRRFLDGIERDLKALEATPGKYEVTLGLAEETEPFGSDDCITIGTTRVLCIGKPSRVELES